MIAPLTRARARSLRVLGLASLVVIGGCSNVSDSEDEGSTDSALERSRSGWTMLGTGVAYKADREGVAGTNVMIVYGGYTAEDAWSQAWADAMYDGTAQTLGIGHLYAVKGPNTAGYTNREIQNSHLAAHLAQNDRAAHASSIIIVAHSSGTYVADELLNQLKNGTGGVPADTIGKIELFNLDGGGVADPELLQRFAHAYFVYSCDDALGICSHNADGMKSLGAQYASLGGALKVASTDSGCSTSVSPGGLWCMHDTLINTKPHNHTMYDLADDYTDFAAPRALVRSYLDVLTPPPPVLAGQ
jgi:hypothetical protein